MSLLKWWYNDPASIPQYSSKNAHLTEFGKKALKKGLVSEYFEMERKKYLFLT